MKIFKSKKTFHDYIERQREMGKKIGFAPTMGALHQGHISLYEAASKENDLVFSSIFVNPTQFNNAADLEKYPRNIENDLKILENSDYVDAVYIPEVSDLYPDGLKSKSYDFDGLENEMEGKFRPGHFDGVGTVVEELLLQVQPDNAYFGEKDFQQLVIIEKLVEKLKLPVKIHGVAIYREKNGLAMSSRNERLSAEQREASKIIYETLLKVNDWFRIITVPEINQRVKDIFEDQRGMVLEYFEISDEQTLKETDFFYKGHNYRAFIVVFVNEVRLIDNMHLE
ncbi:pantoate--beta-alanine ligase [Kaistella jeonii]|uniref:Pantothenate synthetase n=1 Tax=Kaistella jeonii TaxID=266749 RepID=A0A0C1FAL3_9FLAO|nr:pantoate--beta-alanine ligase [Kaistella jeonii]KIA88958.1 pantothenate synthetase [Kaistella jeonii]SFB98109.1 pantoate--beta-alanine ligase [Kaistella jeonii]VEI97253.1 Pantothenate synthetase [Kaistella jeonii]